LIRSAVSFSTLKLQCFLPSPKQRTPRPLLITA